MLDEELIALLRRDSEKGLEILMNQYISYVYTIVNSKLSSQLSKEDIEECCSDIFVEIHRNRFVIDLSQGSLKSFLATISKRKAIDYFRKKAIENSRFVSMGIVKESILTNENGESLMVEREARNNLLMGIKSLGNPDYEIFIRKYFFKQSTKQISKVLDIKENTIDKKVSRGLFKLSQTLGGLNDGKGY